MMEFEERMMIDRWKQELEDLKQELAAYEMRVDNTSQLIDRLETIKQDYQDNCTMWKSRARQLGESFSSAAPDRYNAEELDRILTGRMYQSAISRYESLQTELSRRKRYAEENVYEYTERIRELSDRIAAAYG